MASGDNVVSLSGHRVVRHGEPGPAPHSCGRALAPVAEHVERHLGPVARVLRATGAGAPALDLLHVAPSAQRPVHTLVTAGMAARPMALPEQVTAPARLELMLTLPRHWPVGGAALAEPHWAWPLRLLRVLAELPVRQGTWLGWGHAVPNGDPPAAYADDTRLAAALLMPSLMVPRAFQQLTLEGEEVGILAVLPLHPQELAVIYRRGLPTLLRRLDARGVHDLIDPQRPPVA